MKIFIGTMKNKRGVDYDLYQKFDEDTMQNHYNLVPAGSDMRFVHCSYASLDYILKLKGF